MKQLMFRLWQTAETAYRHQLLAELPPTDDLLDVGCGNGGWTEQLMIRANLTPAGWQGSNWTPSWLRKARERGFNVEIAALEDRWPFSDQTFGLVHANQVIEHVKDLDHVVSETKRVLRPGGVTVVCTENLASWHNTVSLLFGWQPFSLTSISEHGPMGNPLTLRKGFAGTSDHHCRPISLTIPRNNTTS